MALHKILPADDPRLRRRAKRVKRIDGSLQALIDDMIETMHAVQGLGLAAPQVGVPLRVIVIELLKDEEEPLSGKPIVLCNPEIVKAKGEDEAIEGCLSVPGYIGEVKRAAAVTVKGRNREWKEMRIKAKGLLARALQHEIDHLDGILFVDHLESLDKLRRIEPQEERRGL